MILLVTGLLIFGGTHALPSMPALRERLVDRLGAGGYAGLYSLVTLASLVAIVLGFAWAPYVHLWTAPAFMYPVMFIAIPIALHLNTLSLTASNIRRITPHPMLWGTALWAGPHLVINGDLRSVALFGFFLVWSLVKIWETNRRVAASGEPPKAPERVSVARELGLAAISLVSCAALIWAHRYFAGVDIVPFFRGLTGL